MISPASASTSATTSLITARTIRFFSRASVVGACQLGSNNFQDRRFNGIVHPQAAEGDATRLTVVEPAPAAAVTRNIVLCARVAERELAPTAVTSDQTCKQSIAVLGGAVMPAIRDVVADHPADRLRALPVDIALMRARVQC